MEPNNNLTTTPTEPIPSQISQEGGKRKVHLIFLIVLVLLITLLGGVILYKLKDQENKGNISEYAGWTTFSNSNYGIELQYPEKEYKIQQGSTFIEVKPIDDLSGNGYMIYTYEIYATTSPLIDYAKSYFGKNYLSSEEVSITGINWLVVKFNDGYFDKIKMYYNKDGTLYTVSYNDNDEILEKIARSLKLTDVNQFGDLRNDDASYPGWKVYSSTIYGVEFKYPDKELKFRKGENFIVLEEDQNTWINSRSLVYGTEGIPVNFDLKEHIKHAMRNSILISSSESTINGVVWTVIKYKNNTSNDNVDREVMYVVRGDKLTTVIYNDNDEILEKIASTIKLIGIDESKAHPVAMDQYYTVETGSNNFDEKRGGNLVKNGGEIRIYFNNIAASVSYYKLTISCDSQIKNIEALVSFKEGDICNIENKLATSTKSVKLKFLGLESGENMSSDIKIEAYGNNDAQIGNTFFSFLSVMPGVASNTSNQKSF